MRLADAVKQTVGTTSLALTLVAVPLPAAAQSFSEILGALGTVAGVIAAGTVCAATAPVCAGAVTMAGGLAGSGLGSLVDGEINVSGTTGNMPLPGGAPPSTSELPPNPPSHV